MPHINRRYL